jgi:uncharacterized membrane protein YphA (DoxX/SURF4 family)
MKILRTIARIIIGLIFIFSGIVKAIDPLGVSYKFHDYFQAFSLGFLAPLSLTLAIFLCTVEFIAGFSVLTGLRLKTGIQIVLILMLVFTPLTLILALTNPVSDCGCFGDAIHLTNWQTFGKNLVLILLSLLLYTGRNQVRILFRSFSEWIMIFCAIVIFVLFSFVNLIYLPLIDFLPYKTGVKIADKMIIPEGVQTDEYKTTFIYEKDGVRKEFDLNNFPAADSAWKFVDQKSVLLKKGYQPPIHDFIITSLEGEDITKNILDYSGLTLLMVSKKLDEAGKKHLEKGFDLGNYFNNKGMKFYILTASGTEKAGSYKNGLQFCLADETTLKTIVRSNPGYLLLKDGTIIGKWSWANVPEKDSFEKQNIENFKVR